MIISVPNSWNFAHNSWLSRWQVASPSKSSVSSSVSTGKQLQHAILHTRNVKKESKRNVKLVMRRCFMVSWKKKTRLNPRCYSSVPNFEMCFGLNLWLWLPIKAAMLKLFWSKFSGSQRLILLLVVSSSFDSSFCSSQFPKFFIFFSAHKKCEMYFLSYGKYLVKLNSRTGLNAKILKFKIPLEFGRRMSLIAH